MTRASALKILLFALLITAVSVTTAHPAFAQRGGGRGGAAGTGRRPVICIYDCREPSSSDSNEKDEARIAHLMAVQANSDQSAAFVNITKNTTTAAKELQNLRDLLQKNAPPEALFDQANKFEETLRQARHGNQNFLAALTPAQSSGLKEAIRKLTRADADLEKELKNFDRVLDPKPDVHQLSTASTNLDKALAAFQSEQLALGSEMSAVSDSEKHEIAFNLDPVTTPLELGGQSISVPAAGAIARTAGETSPDTYSIRFVADLSELQDNLTPVIRSLLNQGARCGQSIEIQQATLIPQSSTALLTIHLHFERWLCPPGLGTATELANNDGSVELKLVPSLAPDAKLQLTAEVNRVDAQGMLRDALLNGDLGDTVREQVASLMLTVLQKAADVRSSLPPSAQPAVALEKARFRDVGTGRLGFLLDGQLKLSGDPTREFAAQLKQRLSAQAANP